MDTGVQQEIKMRKICLIVVALFIINVLPVYSQTVVGRQQYRCDWYTVDGVNEAYSLRTVYLVQYSNNTFTVEFHYNNSSIDYWDLRNQRSLAGGGNVYDAALRGSNGYYSSGFTVRAISNLDGSVHLYFMNGSTTLMTAQLK